MGCYPSEKVGTVYRLSTLQRHWQGTQMQLLVVSLSHWIMSYQIASLVSHADTLVLFNWRHFRIKISKSKTWQKLPHPRLTILYYSMFILTSQYSSSPIRTPQGLTFGYALFWHKTFIFSHFGQKRNTQENLIRRDLGTNPKTFGFVKSIHHGPIVHCDMVLLPTHIFHVSLPHHIESWTQLSYINYTQVSGALVPSILKHY